MHLALLVEGEGVGVGVGGSVETIGGRDRMGFLVLVPFHLEDLYPASAATLDSSR